MRSASASSWPWPRSYSWRRTGVGGTCGASTVDALACGAPQVTLLALGAPMILLPADLRAFVRTYQVWREVAVVAVAGGGLVPDVATLLMPR